MSAETFTTAMFLITAVIASGVLINAVFPVVYQMSGTFASSTHESDLRLRTDFKIVTYYANGADNQAEIWMKNIGTQKIAILDITKSDVFCGDEGNFGRLAYIPYGTLSNGKWTTDFTVAGNDYNLNDNEYWDSGETLHILAKTSLILPSGGNIYYQFILPDGIWRSITFTAR